MKKIYLEFLRNILDERIPDELNGFCKLKVKIPALDKKKSTMYPNEIVYEKRVNDKLSLFLSIVPDSKQEHFMLQIGWSDKGRFPWDTQRNLGAKSDKSEFLRDETVINYGSLYVLTKEKTCPAHIGWELWKCSVPVTDPKFAEKFMIESLAPVSEEVAKQRVNDAIDKFIDDVKRLVLPYFEEKILHYES